MGDDMTIRNQFVGMHKSEIDTPALLLDLAAMEKNLNIMANFFADKTCKLRPHVKIYRATPILAHKQIEAGAIGVTCAKLCEAEVLAGAGIKDILIANQIVGPEKIRRLTDLAAITDVVVAVDHPSNIDALSRAAQTTHVTIGVLIEVNIGHNRCGVAPFTPALELARKVELLPGLVFKGLMGYDGHCTMKVAESEREVLSIKANTILAETCRFIVEKGINVAIVSGSGTFTYRFASKINEITEIQAGTYLLMDTAFKEHGVREFDCALSVLTSVISKPTYPEANDLVIIDAGRKSLSTDLGLPDMKYPGGAFVKSLSDEHGRIIVKESTVDLQVGNKIELWVRDANGTINQFDRFYCIRNDLVEDVWAIPICGVNT